MKNEVGDKSPNEVALSVLIEGDTFARQNKLHNRKNLRANPLVLFRLFLLSPKSLLCNTFRGPRKRFALFIGSDDLGAPVKAACRTRHALQCFSCQNEPPFHIWHKTTHLILKSNDKCKKGPSPFTLLCHLELAERSFIHQSLVYQKILHFVQNNSFFKKVTLS